MKEKYIEAAAPIVRVYARAAARQHHTPLQVGIASCECVVTDTRHVIPTLAVKIKNGGKGKRGYEHEINIL